MFLKKDDMDFIGYRIKLYPTPEQEQEFRKYFGVSRFVYNLGLDLQEDLYQRSLKDETIKHNSLSFVEMNNILNDMKRNNEDLKWLNDFDSTSIKIILKDVRSAYDKFFEGKCKHPKKKHKKYHHQMFPIRADRLEINEDSVRIPSIGIVKCDKHNNQAIIGNGNKNLKIEHIDKHYYNTRVIFNGYSYYLTLSLELSPEDGVQSNSCKRFKNNEIWANKDYSEPIGIDLGCKRKNWIVDSKGNRIIRPDCTKEEKQIKKYFRKLSIKQQINRGKRTNSTVASEYTMLEEVEKPNYTKNEEKILRKLDKAYKRRSNKKLDSIHKYACSIIQEKPSCIIMEDLEVKKMFLSKSEEISCTHRRRHNKLVHDSMLYTARVIIEQKAKSNNIPFILADKEYPSSQLCSKCGYRQKIGLLRTYKCPCCGNEIDRDENAALNLSHLGYPEYNQYDYIIA